MEPMIPATSTLHWSALVAPFSNFAELMVMSQSDTKRRMVVVVFISLASDEKEYCERPIIPPTDNICFATPYCVEPLSVILQLLTSMFCIVAFAPTTPANTPT